MSILIIVVSIIIHCPCIFKINQKMHKWIDRGEKWCSWGLHKFAVLSTKSILITSNNESRIGIKYLISYRIKKYSGWDEMLLWERKINERTSNWNDCMNAEKYFRVCVYEMHILSACVCVWLARKKNQQIYAWKELSIKSSQFSIKFRHHV